MTVQALISYFDNGESQLSLVSERGIRDAPDVVVAGPC